MAAQELHDLHITITNILVANHPVAWPALVLEVASTSTFRLTGPAPFPRTVRVDRTLLGHYNVRVEGSTNSFTVSTLESAVSYAVGACMPRASSSPRDPHEPPRDYECSYGDWGPHFTCWYGHAGADNPWQGLAGVGVTREEAYADFAKRIRGGETSFNNTMELHFSSTRCKVTMVPTLPSVPESPTPRTPMVLELTVKMSNGQTMTVQPAVGQSRISWSNGLTPERAQALREKFLAPELRVNVPAVERAMATDEALLKSQEEICKGLQVPQSLLDEIKQARGEEARGAAFGVALAHNVAAALRAEFAASVEEPFIKTSPAGRVAAVTTDPPDPLLDIRHGDTVAWRGSSWSVYRLTYRDEALRNEADVNWQQGPLPVELGDDPVGYVWLGGELSGEGVAVGISTLEPVGARSFRKVEQKQAKTGYLQG